MPSSKPRLTVDSVICFLVHALKQKVNHCAFYAQSAKQLLNFHVHLPQAHPRVASIVLHGTAGSSMALALDAGTAGVLTCLGLGLVVDVGLGVKLGLGKAVGMIPICAGALMVMMHTDVAEGGLEERVVNGLATLTPLHVHV
jgi:hypothetical protein